MRENAYLRPAFALADPHDAYGKAIAQQRSNHGMRGAFMAKEKILIVDDEPMIRWTLNEALRGWEYDTVEAGTGAGAPAPLQADRPAGRLVATNHPPR